MRIDEIEAMLAGRGKYYTAEEVTRCMDIYGDIIPHWYADLWTRAAIFEADMYAYEKELEDEAWAKISVLRLDGPDDGWKKDDQIELTRAGYFSLGMWQNHAYWLITPSRSTSQEAPIRIIDHEVADDLEQITTLEGIQSFNELLDSVVNFPILRAIDRWRAFMDRESKTPDPSESFRGLSSLEIARKIQTECTEKLQGKAHEDYRFWDVMKALGGEYPNPVELDEDDHNLPKALQAELLSDLRREAKRWEAARIGPLPHYEEEELPEALRYVWDHLEENPLGPWKLQRGAALLRLISMAFEQGIPHQFFVIGQQEEQFVTLDLTRPGQFGDCPVVTWPAQQELAQSLGEWLMNQTP